MTRLAILLPLVWTLCAASEANATRDELLRVFDRIPSSDALQLRTRMPGQMTDRVELGSRITHQITAGRAAFVTVLQVNGQGELAVLADDQHLPDGHELMVPPTGYELRTTLPVGPESVLVLASTRPIRLSKNAGGKRGEPTVLDSLNAIALAEKLLTRTGDLALARSDYEVLPTETATGAIYAASSIVDHFRDTPPSIRRRRLDLYIGFEPGSDALTEAAKRELDEVGKALQNDQIADLGFDLVGHTDDSGAREFNRALSIRRAAAARAYLVEHWGVAPTRVRSRGVGESEPVAEGSSDEARARNRRVVMELRR
jgi:outer membrane protein OmpA-like peptidoglycan-associated protein